MFFQHRGHEGHRGTRRDFLRNSVEYNFLCETLGIYYFSVLLCVLRALCVEKKLKNHL